MAYRDRRKNKHKEDDYDTYSSDTDYYSETDEHRKACIKRTRYGILNRTGYTSRGEKTFKIVMS